MCYSNLKIKLVAIVLFFNVFIVNASGYVEKIDKNTIRENNDRNIAISDGNIAISDGKVAILESAENDLSCAEPSKNKVRINNARISKKQHGIYPLQEEHCKKKPLATLLTDDLFLPKNINISQTNLIIANLTEQEVCTILFGLVEGKLSIFCNKTIFQVLQKKGVIQETKKFQSDSLFVKIRHTLEKVYKDKKIVEDDFGADKKILRGYFIHNSHPQKKTLKVFSDIIERYKKHQQDKKNKNLLLSNAQSSLNTEENKQDIMENNGNGNEDDLFVPLDFSKFE